MHQKHKSILYFQSPKNARGRESVKVTCSSIELADVIRKAFATIPQLSQQLQFSSQVNINTQIHDAHDFDREEDTRPLNMSIVYDSKYPSIMETSRCGSRYDDMPCLIDLTGTDSEDNQSVVDSDDESVVVVRSNNKTVSKRAVGKRDVVSLNSSVSSRPRTRSQTKKSLTTNTHDDEEYTTELDCFLKKYKPTIKRYSPRSIVLRPSVYIPAPKKQQFSVLSDSRLSSHLYLNPYLRDGEGWITSDRNQVILERLLK